MPRQRTTYKCVELLICSIVRCAASLIVTTILGKILSYCCTGGKCLKRILRGVWAGFTWFLQSCRWQQYLLFSGIGSLIGMTSELLWLNSWRWNAGRKRSFWIRSYKMHWNIISMIFIYSRNITLNGVGRQRWLHLKIIWDWRANQWSWQLWRYVF